jgi:hypothetical protein
MVALVDSMHWQEVERRAASVAAVGFEDEFLLHQKVSLDLLCCCESTRMECIYNPCGLLVKAVSVEPVAAATSFA